jgi:tetratricopeptide (TPR) repeat protein
MFRAEWKRCIEIAGRIALMASEFGSPRYRTCERVLSGVTAYYAGRFSEARILLDESMSVLQTGDAAMRRTIPLGSLEAWVGLVRCITGHPEQGLALERRTERQLTLSEGASPMSLEAWRAKLHQSSDPGATFTTLGWWHGKLHQFRDEKNAVAYLARKAAPEIANAHSLLIFQTYNTIFLVWARASRDVNSEERVRMLETLQSALRNAERMELRLGRAYLLGLSADACARLGERAAALGYLAEAFEWLERTDERFFEAELLRIRASLTPALHEKLALLDAAVAVALQQGAVWWALRAATERVTVRRDGPSVAQLAELYFGFSEGFGLPDLRRARAALASIL